MMTTDHKQDWNNYWQGRSAEVTGNALLGVGIENNDVLTQFWQDIFASIPNAAKLVDFACGAGSVLKQAQSAGLSNLTGIDISDKAIEVLQTKQPDVTGYVCPVDETPFENDSFDVVVSQFGFEYAGNQAQILRATNEMARILRAKGEIVLVAHIENGAIQRGCRQSLEQIVVILQSGFFDTAKATFSTIYKAHELPEQQFTDAVKQSMLNLNLAVEPIMVWLKSAANQKNDFVRFIHYLIESTQKLLSKVQNYTLEDCLSWFGAMQTEIMSYQGRMSSMIDAAISEVTATHILEQFSGAGLKTEALEKLYFIQGDDPAAWVLRARRI